MFNYLILFAIAILAILVIINSILTAKQFKRLDNELKVINDDLNTGLSIAIHNKGANNK